MYFFQFFCHLIFLLFCFLFLSFIFFFSFLSFLSKWYSLIEAYRRMHFFYTIFFFFSILKNPSIPNICFYLTFVFLVLLVYSFPLLFLFISFSDFLFNFSPSLLPPFTFIFLMLWWCSRRKLDYLSFFLVNLLFMILEKL